MYILNIYEQPYYKFIQAILLYFLKLFQMTYDDDYYYYYIFIT
jgi:hypothetical protein